MVYISGDHPEIQSASGNSQGGTFPCLCGCPVYTNLTNVLSRSAMTRE